VLEFNIAAQYHIDLPIYYKTTDNDSESFFDSSDVPELAHKDKDWIPSDPYAFRIWFEEKAKGKEQFKKNSPLFKSLDR